LPDRQRKIWYQLIAKAQKASGGKPSQKYLKGGIQERKRYYGSDLYDYHTFIFLDGLNNETLKGFVWMCAHFHDATTLQNIANLGERCHKKVSGVGSPAAAVGNACFYLSIDDYGLNEGKRTYTFDDYTATIRVVKPGKSSLTWLKPDGKTQKSIPAFVKNKHAAKLKKMKNTIRATQPH